MTSLRALIICLLVLALPLKAMAGLVSWGCGPGHHGAAHLGLHTSAFDPGGPTGSWTPAAPSGSASAHHHALTPDTALVSDHASGADTRDDLPREQGAPAERCSACTPCSVALAPAPETAVAPDRHLRSVLRAPRDDARADPVVDVPLEPPRSRLT